MAPKPVSLAGQILPGLRHAPDGNRNGVRGRLAHEEQGCRSATQPRVESVQPGAWAARDGRSEVSGFCPFTQHEDSLGKSVSRPVTLQGDLHHLVLPQVLHRACDATELAVWVAVIGFRARRQRSSLLI